MVKNLRSSVVLDTNTLISSLIFEGQLAPLANMMVSKRFHVFTTRELLEELAKVLEYPKISKVIAKRGLSAESIIRAVVENATIVIAKPLGETVIVADPDDDAVLACAVTAGADYIISGDAHLTDLASFRSIPILTPSQFLNNTK